MGKIVIVGGGVAGLKLATNLAKKLSSSESANITLIDNNKFHFWKPWLHKLATGNFDRSTDLIDYVLYAYNHGFKFQFGSLKDIYRDKKNILLEEIYDCKGNLLVPKRYLSYDILVISVGSVSNNFSINGVDQYCTFLDSAKTADSLRKKITNIFLKLYHQNNLNKTISIAVVGGGATGVEFLSELCSLLQRIISLNSFKLVNRKILNLILIESGNKILPNLPIHLSEIASYTLKSLGVQILVGTNITKVKKDGLYTENNKYIPTDLIIWTAGIKAPNFLKNIGGLETNYINQLIVKKTLQTTLDSNIFAIGDCSSCLIDNGIKVPARAQAASQMARCAQYNILAFLKKKPLKSYEYKDYGVLISLANFKTIGLLNIRFRKRIINIKGIIARLMYLSLYRIHQIKLHGLFKVFLIILVNIINRLIKLNIKL